MIKKSIHLGDGAYASWGKNGWLFITADHHEPAQASAAVYIDAADVQRLVDFIQNEVLPAPANNPPATP